MKIFYQLYKIEIIKAKTKYFKVNRLYLIFIIFLFLYSVSCKENNDYDDSIENGKAEQKDVLTIGVKLSAPTPQPEKYFNDLIHPCIRFIPEGFAGHKWWMVASPYRGGDNQIENPILFYGDSRGADLPPIEWKPWGIIVETPIGGGYNSDPSLFFDGTSLWIFWRENGTVSCAKKNMKRATFGIYSNNGITFSNKKFFAGEPSDKEDNEMCPIIIEIDGNIKMYGVKHQFEAPRLPLGLTIWNIEDCDFQNNIFVKEKEIKPKYKQGFDLWHTDFFEYNNLIYCVATPEAANEILLGVSNDGENFTFWDRPLISTKNSGCTYLYKASAMVHNGVFYLWNPVAEEGVTPRTTRIWMSSIRFDELMNKLNN